jgi:phage terminase Nu1 subunit (DNA packaging protein)
MKSTAATIERSELAELLGVTAPRISQLAKEGIFSPDKSGNYPLVESLKAACVLLRDRAGIDDLKSQKLEKQNRLLDYDIERASGQLLDAKDVERAWINIILLTKQRLLRIPNKVSPRLPFCKSEADMEQEIQREVDEALLELSRPVTVGDSAK